MTTTIQPEACAAPESVVVRGQARFTVLTEALIRLEWHPHGRFEDRASQVFVNRRLPAVEHTVTDDGDAVTIETAALRVRYRAAAGPFDDSNLSVEVRGLDPPVTWTPGTPDVGNLGGTVRTLDGVSGGCPLDPGLVSRDGWTLVDDSASLVFDRYPDGWLRPRDDGDGIDWYFLGHGRDYAAALGDYVRVAGRIPVPPRYAFGLWWSRYWPYTDRELRDLVAEFRDHDVPLDVLCVDMDWHLEGWTGYTWNPECFPDPGGFLNWAHDQGLHVNLNLHPADGVGRHEAAFVEMAARLGLDGGPGSDVPDPIPFDCAEPRFMKAYFELLHHPLQRQGVDFWWIDWQQGNECGLDGLDPLWWLNHTHWHDLAAPRRRSLLLSRWGGLGSHRYPVQFSGDTHSDWESLAFQPPFTTTAANVAAAYWSHDIGGHFHGPVEGELYLRWIQFGCFSPILRTHAARDPQAERRIWAFDDEIFRAARDAIRFRYRLMPYLYTAAHRAFESGVAVCRPVYYDHPDLEEAYAHPGEYFFGDHLLVAPVTRPVDPQTRRAAVDVWLPPGGWLEFATGVRYQGPQVVRLDAALDEIPLFVREGAVIPMGPIGAAFADPLELHVFGGESGGGLVIEDDGVSSGYLHGERSRTTVTHALAGGHRRVTIDVEGTYPGRPATRRVEIHLRGGDREPSVVVLNDHPAGEPATIDLGSEGG